MRASSSQKQRLFTRENLAPAVFKEFSEIHCLNEAIAVKCPLPVSLRDLPLDISFAN